MMLARRELIAVVLLAGLAAACGGGGHRRVAQAPSISTTSVPSTVATSEAPTSSTAATPSTAAPATTTSTRLRATTTVASRVAPPTGPSIAGCSLFPSDNPWRRDISNEPLDPHSGAWVASVGSGVHLHPDFGSDPSYGIPYVVVPASQPKVPITFTAYGDESDPGPYPVPPGAPIEAGSDHHVLVASGDCHLYEMFDASPNGQGGWNAASGAIFDLRSDALRPDTWTSADAAGLPILPGLARWDEIQSGHIDHALRFTVARTQQGFIHPATHQAGATTDINVPPMGARFRLKASSDLSPFHGASLVILECLRRYGMFVADNGSNWYISGSTDSRWNDNDLNQLKTVPGSAFEVVATGPILH
jgi:hypothetical protein